MSRLKTKIFGTEVQSPVFIGSGPNTDRIDSSIEAIENGAGAVEITFLTGKYWDEMRRGDTYTILPDKKSAFNGGYFGLMSTGMMYNDIPEANTIQHKIDRIRTVADAAKGRALVVASIGFTGYRGDGKYSWGDMARMAEQEAGATAISLHLQTGNAMAGGLFSREPEYFEGIVKEVRKATTLPVIAKLPIEGCEPQLVADIADDLGCDAVAPTGRLISLDFDIFSKECRLGGHTGFGGSIMLPNTLAWSARMFNDRPNRVTIPGGGVCSWQDIVKTIMAGATMMQTCTWPMTQGYGVIGNGLKKVEKFMAEQGYNSVEEMRGIVAKEATSSGELWSRILKRTDGPYYGIAVNNDKCVGCGKCVPNCYFDALAVKNKKALIDPEYCVGCGCCYGVCPFDAIEMKQ